MKKVFGKLLRWLLGISISLIVLAIIYLVVFRSTIRKMTPVETGQLTEDVFAIKDKYVNLYLVRDGNDFIAFDAGIKPGTVRSQMKKLGIDPDRVRAVFLTHTDSDHAGALSLFKKAEVYLHKDEEQMINGETGRMLWIGNRISTSDYLLLDDKKVRMGDVRIEPVPTPGHTTGLTCYIVNDIYLFTGDAVSLQNGIVGLFPKFINKNARRARKSVNNITGLDGVQYIFTAHHGYSANYESAVSNYGK